MPCRILLRLVVGHETPPPDSSLYEIGREVVRRLPPMRHSKTPKLVSWSSAFWQSSPEEAGSYSESHLTVALYPSPHIEMGSGLGSTLRILKSLQKSLLSYEACSAIVRAEVELHTHRQS